LIAEVKPPLDLEFRKTFFGSLLDHCFAFCSDNRDWLRYTYNWRGRLAHWSGDRIYSILAKFGLVRRHYNQIKAAESLEFILAHLSEFEMVHSLLADPGSRRRFVDVLLLRMLGERHVRLPLDYRSYAACDASIQASIVRKNTVSLPGYIHPLDTHNPLALHCYELHGHSGPIRLHANGFTVRNTFCLEQYVFNEIRAQPGDAVIDGGGCWGDTALFFADHVGENGAVHSFEFDTDNISIFEKNLELNPLLKPRVKIVPFALWRTSGERLSITGAGAVAAVVGSLAGSGGAQTKSIDDYVREASGTVNFIKLDIEGAELNALRGAEQTIHAFRPKLAVCLYHSLSDFIRIPLYLDGLQLDYRFHLGHVTSNHEETVLFAAAHTAEPPEH
jgi:FkbM family methyltransferase